MSELFRAVSNGDADALRAALASGANPDTRDASGRVALMYAVIDGEAPLAALLLRGGADPSASDEDGRTALHFAAQGFRVAIGALLLQHNADVDAKDVNGNTPLSDAAFYSEGRGEMIRLLLRNGADPDTPNKFGVSPIELARSIANYEVVRFFET